MIDIERAPHGGTLLGLTRLEIGLDQHANHKVK